MRERHLLWKGGRVGYTCCKWQGVAGGVRVTMREKGVS